MTTTYEQSSNGYRVTVNDTACFVWTLCFGAFFFLVRGSVRHFVIGCILGLCTFGLSWLIYPFFAPGILRTLYMERGYREVETPPEPFVGSLVTGAFLLLVIGLGAYWFSEGRTVDEFSPPTAASDSEPIAEAVPVSGAGPSFASVEEAQREAVRLYPALAVPTSAFNRAFLAKHREYRELAPSYFDDPR